MFHFQQCDNAPEQGGRGGYGYGGVGLVEIEGSVMWRGAWGQVHRLNEKDKWGPMIDGGEAWASLCVYGGRLASVGGWKDGLRSKKVMVWERGRWSLLPDMLVGCRGSGPLDIDSGGMVVVGGLRDCGRMLNDVQVFDGKTQTWHKGPPLPRPCTRISAAIHGNQIFAMGGQGMGTEVWNANISDLTAADHQQSVWSKLPDVPHYRSSVCVVGGMVFAFGGEEEDDWTSEKTSAIYGFNPHEKKWQHVSDMPHEGDLLDTVMLSGGRLLVVSQWVLRGTVEELDNLFPNLSIAREGDKSEVL